MPNEQESAVQIDEHDLVGECVKHPHNYLRWSHRCADLRRDMDELDAKIDLLKAELDNRIRETPAKFGLEKVTESAIKQAIARNEEYNQMLKDLRRLKHELDRTQAVVSALEHKKRSLTLLVEMSTSGFHSSIKNPAAGRPVDDVSALKRNRRRRDHDDA